MCWLLNLWFHNYTDLVYSRSNSKKELYAIFHHYYRAIKFVFCRLIVVAEKQIVYDKFPIPLINRLEKHFLSLKTLLPPAQLELADKLQKWAQNLCKDKTPALYGQK